LKRFAIFFIIFAFPSFAADLDDLTKRAQDGEPSAQSQLGYYYLNIRSDGLEEARQNIALGKSWLQKAAAQGDIDAAYDLGVISEEEGNFLSAVRYYRMAESDPHTKLRLARLYSEGLGVVRDEAAAMRLIISAGESGETEALYLAGLRYMDGRGVKADYKKAAEMFLSASNNLYPPAYTMLGQLYDAGLGLEKDAAAAEIYYQKAYDAGDTEGMYLLGALLEKRQDYENAAFYYSKAEEKGERRSAAKLGYFYENGIGVEKDYKAAARLYLKSAGTDGGFSENRLGALHREGLGGDADPELAREWFIKSIKQGYTLSYRALGYMYLLGNFGEVNQVRGCAYLYKTGEEKDAAYCDGILSSRAQKAARNLELVK
jgi:TPR repeat protein